MTHTRRTALKLIVAGGGLVVGTRHLIMPATASPAVSSVVPLVGDSRADDAFITGIRTGLAGSRTEMSAPLRLSAGGRLSLTEFDEHLAELKGRRIIGLLDEARHTILDELFRHLGARVFYTGRHTAGGQSGSCHHLVTTPCTRGIASALADGMALGSEGFLIHETAFGSNDLIRNSSARLRHDGGWAGMTGEALARVAAGTWAPQSAGRHQRTGSQADAANIHGLVSFEVQM